jgi:hypothetical protein
MGMSRRGFLKSLACLAGAAAVANIGLRISTETDAERLARKVASGIVENEVFHLYEPVDLAGFSNLVIRNCRFVYLCEVPYMVYMNNKSSNVLVDNCHFETRIAV